MNSLYSKDKIIILLPPDKDFVKQFCKKKKFKKIVWKRKNKSDNVIALEEWNEIALLRYLYGVPLISMALITFLIFLLFVGPIYFINKQKANALFDKYMKGLNWFLKENKNYSWRTVQQDADDIICNKSPKNQYYILYLHENQKELLKEIDSNVAGKYIDQIWVYKHTAEIFERVIKENAQNIYSKIVDYQNVSTHSTWNTKGANKSDKQVDFVWIGNINLQKTIFNVSAIKLPDGRIHHPRIPAPRITLKPNEFLNNEIVFYYESTYHPDFNHYLTTNYTAINEKLANKGMRFLYIPRVITNKQGKSLKELIEQLAYKYPHLFMSNNVSYNSYLQEVLNSIDLQEYYSNIAELLGIPDIKNPCFLHSVEKENSKSPDRTYRYSIHEFTNLETDILDKEINHYLELVRIPRDEVFYSLATPDPNDPDELFNIESRKISEELSGVLEKMRAINDEVLIIDSLMFIVKKLNESNPDFCTKLNNALTQKISSVKSEISRLHIDEYHRIILLDYNNLEISMTPLQKTIYLFFLKNKDGIRLKELSNYRSELIDIYLKVGNRLDMEQIKKSINDLTDATSNSINEKCSKIKEAFLTKIDDSIAQQYYITGNRSENKRIVLDRSLVTYSESK